jgi:hypothetical protein
MRKTLATAVAATATLAAVVATVPAQATGTHHHALRGAAFKVVASGLHGPRQITFAGGDMYVAEAGQGGTGVCIAGGEGPSCYGATGSVTRVRKGTQHRVLKGLASLSNQGTADSPIGPSDLKVVGSHTLILTMGLGAAPHQRTLLPKLGQKQLGHVLSFNLRTKKATSVADLAKFEAKANPVNEANSDPTGLVKAGKAGWLATDSGGNDLVATKNGKVKALAAFRNRMGTSPVTGPDPVPYEAVPTDVVKGPDGAYYVSELTGFPFIPGAARIWRVVPGHKAKVWATGLTNVTSLAFDGKKLYAVQIADLGLTDAGGPVGSLRRVFSDASGKADKPIATGLFAPYGVAIHRGSAYVSTGAVASTDGTVIKVPLG